MRLRRVKMGMCANTPVPHTLDVPLQQRLSTAFVAATRRPQKLLKGPLNIPLR